MLGSLLFTFAFLWSTYATAPAGPWDNFNLAPASRTLWPASVRNISGTVSHAQGLLKPNGRATLSEKGSWVTLDFGKEVGGLISLHLGPSSRAASLSMAFTESPVFIGPISDDSSYPAANMSYDSAYNLPSPLPTGYWTQPAEWLRGGFRYLTLTNIGEAELSLGNVSVSISFMPHWSNLRNYTGYFFAEEDDMLNRIWYAGAYTVQTNTVPLHTGRQVPFVSSPGWANNATLGVAGPIIVDGAKRDRAVWPGDMGIAVPTQFVTTNDLLPTRHALSTMFAAQDPVTGALPESGPPLSQTGSDTYHAWTLIGTHNYFLYSGDMAWLHEIWLNYTKAVAFLEGKVDSSGLMNQTGLRDWARLGPGGHNSEANVLLYKVLTNSVDLAGYMSDSELRSAWSKNATALKSAFNNLLWDEGAGQYRDNETTTLHPQDGNSLAILYNITISANQSQSISRGLTYNWNDLGAIPPELPDTISPFISGFEVMAHFEAGNDDVAMDLLRRTWGYMVTTNLSVQSTLLEGFTANGSLYYRSYRGYNYDPAYTSHSHGWSSGATSALTYYVLGLTVTSPSGKNWSLAPHLSGLRDVQGGFETSLGWFGARWTLSNDNDTLSIELETPVGTNGVITLPGWVSSSTTDRLSNEGSYAVEGGEHSLSFRAA